MSIQRENFEDIEQEIQPLWERHYKELSNEDRLNPLIEAYREMDDLGGLVIITMRDEGILIGYSFFIIQYSLHYKHKIVASNDLFYLSPEYRGKFLGLKLIKESERILAELGINQIQMRTKVRKDFGSILKRAGYEEEEITYRKEITSPCESLQQ